MNIQNLNCLIDLHLHLDGSLPLHTVKELAEQQGITLQMTDGELKKKLSVPAGCRDLNEYLTKFEFPLTLMQTPEALEKCMHDLLTELEGQGVQYCEVRFAPQLHTQKGIQNSDSGRFFIRHTMLAFIAPCPTIRISLPSFICG